MKTVTTSATADESDDKPRYSRNSPNAGSIASIEMATVADAAAISRRNSRRLWPPAARFFRPAGEG